MKNPLYLSKFPTACLLIFVGANSLAEPPFINDPYFQPSGTDLNYQWGLHALNLPQAWEYAQGHAYIAMLDTGIEVAHSDLQQNFRPHLSWDFRNTRWDVDELTPGNDNVTIDDVGHGTHVAGILAATTNNGTGGAGVCWYCSLMVGKIVSTSPKSGGGYTLGVDHYKYADAMITAIDTGAQVITASFGTFGIPCPSNTPIVSYQERCRALAHAKEMDVVVVAASGNSRDPDSTQKIEFPAIDPYVIGVGAIDIDGVLTNWSKYGEGLDLVGPGAHILSTFYTDRDWLPVGTDVVPNECANSLLPEVNNFGPCSGTSMAAPYIAGSAALLRSVNPLLTSAQVKHLLTRHASKANNPDTAYGHGLPDMLKSVKSALGTSNGQTIVNRLTPLFSLYSGSAQDHLYTTSPQTAMAAMYERLLPQPETGVEVNWSHGEGQRTPGYSDFPRMSFFMGYLPYASVYLFTTHRNPENPGRDLIPLYRMSYSGDRTGRNPSNIDHVYTTVFSELDVYKERGYKLDGIEGYIFPFNAPQPSGSVKLYRKYNSEWDDHAIFPEDMLSQMAYKGYTQNSGREWLGYVYPNIDSDYDGLIDGFEQVIGTDSNNPDSDYDGINDGNEVNNYPYSDPLRH